MHFLWHNGLSSQVSWYRISQINIAAVVIIQNNFCPFIHKSGRGLGLVVLWNLSISLNAGKKIKIFSCCVIKNQSRNQFVSNSFRYPIPLHQIQAFISTKWPSFHIYKTLNNIKPVTWDPKLKSFLPRNQTTVHNHTNNQEGKKKAILSLSKTNPELKIYQFLSFNVFEIFINGNSLLDLIIKNTIHFLNIVERIETLCFLPEIEANKRDIGYMSALKGIDFDTGKSMGLT